MCSWAISRQQKHPSFYFLPIERLERISYYTFILISQKQTAKSQTITMHFTKAIALLTATFFALPTESKWSGTIKCYTTKKSPHLAWVDTYLKVLQSGAKQHKYCLPDRDILKVGGHTRCEGNGEDISIGFYYRSDPINVENIEVKYETLYNAVSAIRDQCWHESPDVARVGGYAEVVFAVSNTTGWLYVQRTAERGPVLRIFDVEEGDPLLKGPTID